MESFPKSLPFYMVCSGFREEISPISTCLHYLHPLFQLFLNLSLTLKKKEHIVERLPNTGPSVIVSLFFIFLVPEYM